MQDNYTSIQFRVVKIKKYSTECLRNFQVVVTSNFLLLKGPVDCILMKIDICNLIGRDVHVSRLTTISTQSMGLICKTYLFAQNF